MSEAEVAEFLGVTLSTMRKWRRRGNGDYPVYHRWPNGSIMISELALEVWMDSRVVAP